MKYLLALGLLLLPLAVSARTPLFNEAPLYQAIQADDVEAAKAALLQDPNANAIFAGSPALVVAAEKASSGMVALLLDHKADANKTDWQGNTALMLAAGVGNEAIVQILINAGAGVDKINRQGMTALMLAAQEGNHECVKLLLAAGADKKVADFTGRTAKDWAQDSRNQPTIQLLH
jgi:uncharacterized protein